MHSWGLLIGVLASFAAVALGDVIGFINAPSLLEQHVARDVFLTLSGVENAWDKMAPRWWASSEDSNAKKAYTLSRETALAATLPKAKFLKFSAVLGIWPSFTFLGHAYGQFLGLFAFDLAGVNQRLVSESSHQLQMGKDAMHKLITDVFLVNKGLDVLGISDLSQKLINNMAYEWERRDVSGHSARDYVTVCDFLREKYITAGKMQATDIVEAKEAWEKLAPGAQTMTWTQFHPLVCSDSFLESLGSSDKQLDAKELAQALHMSPTQTVPRETLQAKLKDLFWKVSSSELEDKVVPAVDLQTAEKTLSLKQLVEVSGPFDVTKLTTLCGNDNIAKKMIELFDTHSETGSTPRLTKAVQTALCSDNKQLLKVLWRVHNFDEYLTPDPSAPQAQKLAWTQYTMTPCEFQLFHTHVSKRALQRAASQQDSKISQCDQEAISVEWKPWDMWFDMYAHSTREASTRLELDLLQDPSTVPEDPASLSLLQFRNLLQGISARDISRVQGTGLAGTTWEPSLLFAVNDPQHMIPMLSDARSEYSEAFYKLVRCNPQRMLQKDTTIDSVDVISFFSYLEGFAKSDSARAEELAHKAALTAATASHPINFCAFKTALYPEHESSVCFQFCVDGVGACPGSFECTTDPELGAVCEPPKGVTPTTGVAVKSSKNTALNGLYTESTDGRYRNTHGTELTWADGAVTKIGTTACTACSKNPAHTCCEAETFEAQAVETNKKSRLPTKQAMDFDNKIAQMFLAIKCGASHDPKQEDREQPTSGISQADLRNFYLRVSLQQQPDSESIATAALVADARANRVFRQFVSSTFLATKKMPFDYYLASLEPYSLQYEGAVAYSFRTLHSQDEFHMFWACATSFASALSRKDGTVTSADVLQHADQIDRALFPKQPSTTLDHMLPVCFNHLRQSMCLKALAKTVTVDKLALSDAPDSYCDALTQAKTARNLDTCLLSQWS